jgi:hypothetical protein
MSPTSTLYTGPMHPEARDFSRRFLWTLPLTCIAISGPDGDVATNPPGFDRDAFLRNPRSKSRRAKP